MSRARLKLAACVLAASVLGSACGGGGDEETAPTTVPEYDAAEGLDSPAADLRTDLTVVLQEHTLLTGLASGAQLAGEDAQPVATVLDQNSAALADVVTRLYGAPAGPQFHEQWRRHIAAMLAFATASAGADKAAIDKAKADVTAALGEVAATLNAANKQLTVENLAEEFDAYARVLQTAITAQAKKDPTAPAKLKAASDHMATTAIVLAAGIVKDKPEEFEGALDGIGAAMRAELTSKLQEHTYLAGAATATVVAGGDLEPPAEALEENSLELARAFGTVYGDDVQRRFLELWREHIKLVVDFAEAAKAGDQPGMALARQGLDEYRTEFASFLGQENPAVDEDELEDDLDLHVDSILTAVQAQAANDPGRVAKLKAAAGHSSETALHLALSIARQFPTKFG